MSQVACGLSTPRYFRNTNHSQIFLKGRAVSAGYYSGSRKLFRWPLRRGVITSSFGHRWMKKHHGIDIAAQRGEKIYAARSGKVVFSGNKSGYGNVVIVSHAGGYHTYYAHTQRNWVRTGASVHEGEAIAQVGSTGRSTGPHLHFEIRYQNTPKNPLPYLFP